ncbi:MAG: hypothetical protein JNJ53_10865 [Rhizobiales bacterium]|nr:hypothetical protein [Hyphomicrobiales bacterium]
MWLRTGNVNVTVNNAVVSGGSSAPNFLTNGAKPGYAFVGPDARTYEIQSVDSETQLTLATNYLGSTASNQAYQIMQVSAAAQASILAQIIAIINAWTTGPTPATLKVGSPTATGAVAAFLGTLLSYEATASGKLRVSKGANANDLILEFAVGLSGRARIGLIGDNNIKLDYSADGTAWTNVWTVDVTNGRWSSGLPFLPKSFTIAGLPASATNAGALAYCSDLGGGAGFVRGDGTGWLRQDPGFATRATNADFTLEALTDAEYQEHTGTLTANRAVTLATTKAKAGARFNITRKGSGAFNLNIGSGPLKALIQNTWCEVIFDGATWKLMKYGAL